MIQEQANAALAKRIPIGCCLTAGTFMPQGAAGASSSDVRDDPVERLLAGIACIYAAGYDFAELAAGAITALPEREFDRLRGELAVRGWSIPVYNSLIPPTLKLTGPLVDDRALADYVGLALGRAAATGAEVVVFGSGGARSVPDGYPVGAAMEQIVRFLHLCGEHAARCGITVAIEPLNRKESNIIRTVAEAWQMAEALKLSHVRVLADAYHMHAEGEPLDIAGIVARAGMLAHVHYAEPDRRFPVGEAKGTAETGPSREAGQPKSERAPSARTGMERLFSLLHESGYSGRISAECMEPEGLRNGGTSLQYVRTIQDKVLTQR